AFNDVLSVNGLRSSTNESGFRYFNKSIYRINIDCYIQHQSFEYKNTNYILDVSNSFATAVMSAKICDYMNKGNNTLEEIKKILSKYSLPSKRITKIIHKSHFKKPIKIPIIVIAANINNISSNYFSFIQQLIFYFNKQGYNGICLSEYHKTDFDSNMLNLLDYPLYNATEKLHFYSSYCNVDYILIHCNIDFINKKLKSKDIDIIVNIAYTKNIKKKGVQCINYSEPELNNLESFEKLFIKIYQYLSS
ncbi:MAG: hypothetical protein FWC09_12365, partial [Lachnospiraceae bacterium]|nr:hypothetical protein [Lachnospiraceae bacterium]